MDEKSAQRSAGNVRLTALRAAFPYTLPILAGFLFLGITCGIYAASLGLPWWVPTLMACCIFAGSAEFVVASMLTATFNPLQTFIMVFVINARHLFYGISMLERFRTMGRKRPYLIFAMCDETFSINFSTRAPEGVDEGWFMTWVSVLNQSYWILGCTLGSLFGNALAMEVEGISFAMTALFVVIFLDQWLKDASHAGAMIGLAASAGMLVLFGADSFILPAMALILVGVLAVRRKVEPKYAAASAEVAGADAGTGGTSGDAAEMGTSPASAVAAQGGDAA